MNKPPKPTSRHEKAPKNTPKRLASWRAARKGEQRSYRVWEPYTLVHYYIEHGVLTDAEAADPDRVAQVLAAAAQAAEPDRIREVLAAHDDRRKDTRK